jgi:uncharacterized membrane protein YhaH (DUF805 family)
MVQKVINELIGLEGRISRLQFWRGILIVMALMTVTFAVIIWQVPILAMAAFIAAPFAIVMLCVQRLHDRNKSGWWVLVFVFLPHILNNLQDKATDGSPLSWLLAVTSLAVSMWGIIEIGILRGTEGDNDYGPDPRAKPAHRLAPSGEIGSSPASDV